MLSGEELLAGSQLEYEIEIPAQILNPGLMGEGLKDKSNTDRQVKLRPLSIKDMQILNRAAKENDSLMAVLMVKQALVEPELSLAQVNQLHVGLLQYLLDQINEISGINTNDAQLNEAVDAPLARAAFILAKEFGWTPQEVGELTLGQILINLQMLKERDAVDNEV